MMKFTVKNFNPKNESESIWRIIESSSIVGAAIEAEKIARSENMVVESITLSGAVVDGVSFSREKKTS